MMVSVLFSTYSTTSAYRHAVHPIDDQTTLTIFPLGNPYVQLSADTQDNWPFAGDWALGNSILLMHDGLWFLEVCQAVTCSDIGQVWEVLKVSKIANVHC